MSKTPLFTVDERMEMLREVTTDSATSGWPFDGLLVDFCRGHDIPAIVKGLRAVSDFDYELQMAQMNYSLAGVETLFMPTNPLYAFLSSSLVKEVATYGGDVSGLVPEPVPRPRSTDPLGRGADRATLARRQPAGSSAGLGFPGCQVC